MARLPRLALDGLPHHVIQQGNNRQPIVADAADADLLVEIACESARQLQVALHAYVVMPNHFHLLATPAEGAALSRWLQAIGRSYVRRFNARHGRTGTLWEGRFRATVVEPGPAVLDCMVAIDSNPVRDGLVGAASEYGASSYRHYAGSAPDRRLVTPEAYWLLGNTPFAREATYAQRVAAGLPADRLERLMQACRHGWAYGSLPFVAGLQNRTERRLLPASPGRRPLNS